jgi:hypothetical protein
MSAGPGARRWFPSCRRPIKESSGGVRPGAANAPDGGPLLFFSGVAAINQSAINITPVGDAVNDDRVSRFVKKHTVFGKRLRIGTTAAIEKRGSLEAWRGSKRIEMSTGGSWQPSPSAVA